MYTIKRGGNKKNKTKRHINCFANIKHRYGSCFTEEHLNTLKQLWNSRHPDKRIVSRKPEVIHKKISNYLSGVCNDELCWIENHFTEPKVQRAIKKQAFAPIAQSSWKFEPNKWLDSHDISNVMRQYEETNKKFCFIGPSPIDFDARPDNMSCVWEDLCNLDISKKYQEGYRKIGMIFNLDPHYKGGSHWVSMFIDLDKNFIFFLDTNGVEIPSEINVLKNRIKKQCKEKLHKKMRFTDNSPTVHQHQDTECGVYSLYALVKLLKEEVTPSQIKKKRIPDEKMYDYRKIFYTHV